TENCQQRNGTSCLMCTAEIRSGVCLRWVKTRRTQDEQNQSALLLKADMSADIRQLRLRANTRNRSPLSEARYARCDKLQPRAGLVTARAQSRTAAMKGDKAGAL